MQLLILVGSLRAGSYNRQVAHAVMSALPGDVTAHIAEGLQDLPYYSEDLDTDPAVPVVAAWRQTVAQADAILVVTPEFNGSMSGVLKNALDWASRPRGRAPIAGKPTAILGASVTPYAAARAREEAVKVLRTAGADVIPETVGVASAASVISDNQITDSATAVQVEALVFQLTERARTSEAA